DHFGHPRKRVSSTFVQGIETNLLTTSVSDKSQIFFEHGGVQAQHAARHGVLCIAVLELDSPRHDCANLVAEFGRPKSRILELDLIDEINTEVTVHRFVP